LAPGATSFQIVDLGVPSGISDVSVATLAEAQDGSLWVGAESGLFHRTTDGHVARYGVADGLPADNVTVLIRSREDRLWVGTTAGVAAQALEPAAGGGLGVRIFARVEGVGVGHVSALIETPSGRIQVATGKGI